MKRKIFLLTLACMFLSLNAFAQKYEIYKKTLKNGLDVIVIQNPAVPLVTIEIDVKSITFGIENLW